jgi:hypothetical protein
MYDDEDEAPSDIKKTNLTTASGEVSLSQLCKHGARPPLVIKEELKIQTLSTTASGDASLVQLCKHGARSSFDINEKKWEINKVGLDMQRPGSADASVVQLCKYGSSPLKVPPKVVIQKPCSFSNGTSTLKSVKETDDDYEVDSRSPAIATLPSKGFLPPHPSFFPNAELKMRSPFTLDSLFYPKPKYPKTCYVLIAPAFSLLDCNMKGRLSML